MATKEDVEITVQEPLEDQLPDDILPIQEQSPDVFRVEESQNDTLRVEEPETSNLDLGTLDPSQLPPEILEQVDIKEIGDLYRKATSVSILITGKTGNGKSSLVNGILGMNVTDSGAAKEGDTIKHSCTLGVTEHTTKKGNVTITIWDTPGLQDGTGNQRAYIKEMKRKCSSRDLTVHCIKMNDTRFVRGDDNPDVIVMKKLTRSFGNDLWKNAVIVLTFANTIEDLKKARWKGFTAEEKATEFKKLIREWREQIRDILIGDVKVPRHIVDTIRTVPAGYYLERSLPDRDYWLSTLWFTCFTAIQTGKGKIALFKINQERFKERREVNDKDFEQEIENQPIVFELTEEQAIGAVVGGGIVGGVVGVGFGCLGLLGGPLAAYTIPSGLALGIVIGAAITGTGIMSTKSGRAGASKAWDRIKRRINSRAHN